MIDQNNEEIGFPGSENTKPDNPFRYRGPLDPIKNKSVCVLRQTLVRKVVTGIGRGEFYTIMGPRQIGKTTLLKLIQKEIEEEKVCHVVYLNFELSPEIGKYLYEMIKEELYKVGVNQPRDEDQSLGNSNIDKDWKVSTPGVKFLNLLQQFQPVENKKVVFLFDEVDGIKVLKDFLHLWRRVFHCALEGSAIFKKYVVITSGSADLIKMSLGPTSPFNIAEPVLLGNFSDEESRWLINQSGILKSKLEDNAKNFLVSSISGHPQLLQHACHLLVDRAIELERQLGKDDVKMIVERLLIENSAIILLKEDIKKNSRLRKLVRKMLNNDKVKFHSFQEYSVLGAGALVKDDENYCGFRSEIYKIALSEFLETYDEDSLEATPKIRIKHYWKKYAYILTILAVIIAFFAVATTSPSSMLVAGILAFIALFLLIIAPFPG